MFKKFFAIIFCCFMVATTATAATIAPRQECILTNKGMIYRDDENAPHLLADYVIHFNNKESKIPTTGESGTPAGKQNCTDEVKNLINELATKKNDIETVLLFGSADSIGKSEANAKLAQERVNTVNKLLNDAGITTCELDDKGNIKKGVNRCATMTMGDAFHLSDDNLERSWEGARTVFMFVIHKNDTCNTETISTLDQLTEIAQKANDTDILQKLNSASELCNKDKDGKLLLHSQRETIDAAINTAVTKFKDKLPGNLKISLLINSVINTRNAMAKNANVWKTAEGNFNGWRLASDSIAGVVLGTAGGLITSHIVKKNQIESGFNDIMCTIGGQSVASYGDEFSVGIR